MSKSPHWNPSEYYPLYGYHRLLPVPTQQTNDHLNITINKQYVRIRPNDHYIVICDHPQCTTSWTQRKTFTSCFKHHHKKHHNYTVIKVKIIGYLTSSKKQRKFRQEYRLINVESLEYVKVNGSFKRSYFMNDKFVTNHIFKFLAFPGTTAPMKLLKKEYIPLFFIKHLIDWGYSLQNKQSLPIQNATNYALQQLRCEQFVNDEWNPFNFDPNEVTESQNSPNSD